MAAETDMEFCLLGPLLVRRGGVPVAISPGMQRSLLAALALAGNKVVSVDELMDALWGDDPPRSARASLQNMVMRLRRSLDGRQPRIIARPDGYQLLVEPGELDVDRFEDLLAEARQARRAGSLADAADRLRAALSLWQGPPLAGVPSRLLAVRDAPRLEEMRLQAIEARIDADLLLGRQADVIAELRQLVAANPLRERLHALLMLALHRDGQQAGAMAAYRAARSVLTSELGVEPGRELRQLHEQILAGEVDVTAPAGWAGGLGDGDCGAAVAGQPGQPVPRQLPPAVWDFVGRAAELVTLASLLDQPAGSAAVAITAICGTAGIGKTTLAVHWAHQVAGRFPDGQLYVNLRGFGPAGPAMTPHAAMRQFLDGLGVPGDRIPASLDAQAALYRSLLFGKRMLIVLDNARDLAQVEPLLPGSAGCLVLITSRNELVGLHAAHGALLLTLDLPSEWEAGEMVARRLGRARVGAEPGAVAELALACARLPIAVCVAAARAASRPDLPLATLAAELRDAGTRLDGLRVGAAATDVRAVFSWSYQQLSEQAARMLRMLGLHPGPDITAAAAASLAGLPLRQAGQALSELADGHLVTERSTGRYDCHDLLRAYAGELARSQDSDAERRDALHRVLDHYLHTACAASRLFQPDRPDITLTPPSPLVEPERPGDRDQAVRWFRAEREVLLAATRRAGEAGFAVHAWQLSWAFAMFLASYGYWHDLAASQQIALVALRQVGEKDRQVRALRVLVLASLHREAYGAAARYVGEALGLARELGDQLTLAHLHGDLAAVALALGDGSDALCLGHAERSLFLYRAAGARDWEAFALNHLGWLHAQYGSPAKAIDLCVQALAGYRELGYAGGEAATLDSLGYAHQRLGRFDEAIEYFQQAISTQGQGGRRGPGSGLGSELHSRADFHVHLGDAHDAAGHPDEARHAWRKALSILDELHGPVPDQLRARLTRQLFITGHPTDRQAPDRRSR